MHRLGVSRRRGRVARCVVFERGGTCGSGGDVVPRAGLAATTRAGCMPDLGGTPSGGEGILTALLCGVLGCPGDNRARAAQALAKLPLEASS